MTNKENKQKLSISIETETLDRIRELTRVLNSREMVLYGSQKRGFKNENSYYLSKSFYKRD